MCPRPQDWWLATTNTEELKFMARRRNLIKQAIALEGGDEIVAQLQSGH
jgi:hypothetical protein